MPKIDIVNAKNIIESNPEKAFFKLKNTGGPKGDTGAQGPQGPKGDTGAQGPAGASASVTVGSTTTLSPGADATVTNSGDTRNAILNFGIPTGARGPQGTQGPKGDTGPMGQTGAKGDTGAAATVQVGNTNTGAPGTNAQVTNAGNEHFAVLNFTIPRGDKGEKGATGAQGQKGDKGDKGDTGTAATITVGSTTTTNPGTNATVTNSGTTSEAVLNFGIPRGATGSVKSEVVSELPETGEEDTFYLVNREATEQTATGKAINFTNSDNSGDITDFQLDGETSQNGTPTPSAPIPVQTVTGENVVKITGKNLWGGFASDFSKTSQGISYTNKADGAIFANGTASGNSLSFISSEAVSNGRIITLQAGNYVISGGTSTVLLQVVSSNGTEIAETDSSGVKAFTLSEATDIFVRARVPRNTVADNVTIYPQLELGSTATAYEPYQEQSYEVNLGKNLFDNDAATDAYIESDGTLTPNSVWRASQLIKVEPNTSYIWHGESYGKPNQVEWAGYDGSKTFISGQFSQVNNVTSTVITTGANTEYLRVGYRSDKLMNMQLELGSQATSYAAYFEPIELCKIGDYQDYIYESEGKWYVRKECGGASLSDYANTTHRGATNTSGKYRFRLVVPGVLPAATTGTTVPSYCSHIMPGTVGQTYTAQQRIAIDVGTNNYVFMFTTETEAMSEDDFKTWLAGKNMSFYYPLATPTDTEITNQALIDQLDNVASAPLYTGVNNITTITLNEQGTLEIKYVTYDKYNQNKVYIWNDDLQQWQIIVQ